MSQFKNIIIAYIIPSFEVKQSVNPPHPYDAGPAPYFDNFARGNVDDELYGNHYVAGPALHFDNFARGNVDDVDGELDGNGVAGNFGNHFGNHNDASVAGNFGNFARGNVDDDADELDGN